LRIYTHGEGSKKKAGTVDVIEIVGKSNAPIMVAGKPARPGRKNNTAPGPKKGRISSQGPGRVDWNAPAGVVTKKVHPGPIQVSSIKSIQNKSVDKNVTVMAERRSLLRGTRSILRQEAYHHSVLHPFSQRLQSNSFPFCVQRAPMRVFHVPVMNRQSFNIAPGQTLAFFPVFYREVFDSWISGGGAQWTNAIVLVGTTGNTYQNAANAYTRLLAPISPANLNANTPGAIIRSSFGFKISIEPSSVANWNVAKMFPEERVAGVLNSVSGWGPSATPEPPGNFGYGDISAWRSDPNPNSDYSNNTLGYARNAPEYTAQANIKFLYGVMSTPKSLTPVQCFGNYSGQNGDVLTGSPQTFIGNSGVTPNTNFPIDRIEINNLSTASTVNSALTVTIDVVSNMFFRPNGAYDSYLGQMEDDSEFDPSSILFNQNACCGVSKSSMMDAYRDCVTNYLQYFPNWKPLTKITPLDSDFSNTFRTFNSATTFESRSGTLNEDRVASEEVGSILPMRENTCSLAGVPLPQVVCDAGGAMRDFATSNPRAVEAGMRYAAHLGGSRLQGPQPIGY